jgi:hypothetical protein
MSDRAYDGQIAPEFDELSDAIFAAYAVIAKKVEERREHRSEHKRRQAALQGIDEILSWRPLASFSATHLEMLELLFAYWRELEVEGEVRADLPDPVH